MRNKTNKFLVVFSISSLCEKNEYVNNKNVLLNSNEEPPTQLPR